MFRLLLVALCLCILACGDEGVETTNTLEATPAAPALAMNCPPTLYKNTSRMRLIPSGNFQMGGGAETLHHKTPEWTAFTEAFYIDTHEVTIGEFLVFVDTTGYPISNDAEVVVDWDTHFETYLLDNSFKLYDFYALPAQVMWADAVAYARWVGKRLPTEVEWEKAARGGLTGAVFTWGDDPPTRARGLRLRNGRHTSMASEGAFNIALSGRVGNFGEWDAGIGFFDDHYLLRPVGSYQPNGYGLFDMLGNVNEWCLDDWNENAYLLMMNGIKPQWAGEKRLGIPASEPAWKVVRGGGLQHFNWIASKRDILHTVSEKKRQQFLDETIDVAERRAGHTQEFRYTGFRCVLDFNGLPKDAWLYCLPKGE